MEVKVQQSISIASLTPPASTTTTAIPSSLVVTTTTTTTAAAVSAATTATTSVRSFIYPDGAAIKFLIVHSIDGCIGISFTAVTNEPETATAAGTSVFHHDGFLNSTEFFKFLAQSIIIRTPS
jgi:hypothetical protein